MEDLNIVGTYNLIYNASLMVRKNMGVAFTLEGLINTEGLDITFLPAKPVTEVSLSLVWKKNYTLSKTAKLFLEQLKKELSH